MAKHITKAQLRQLYQAQLFDNDEYLRLLKEFAGIESRPTTEYNHFDENGEFIGSSVDTDLSDLLDEAGVEVLDVGKIPNEEIYKVLCWPYEHLAIEMVAGMGMPVGQEVFDTCFWIGRFWEYAEIYRQGYQIQKIFRREEKLYLCGRATAKDANIRQALVDRYAPGQPNYGKGTKKNPGFFYGFSADMWAAMAVAVTYFDKYIRGIQL